MITYDHPRHGLIRAVETYSPDGHTANDWADWTAVSPQAFGADETTLGYVIDERSDCVDSDGPSEMSPADDDDAPYAAYGARSGGAWIGNYHSLTGALAAIGNDYAARVDAAVASKLRHARGSVL